jgi:hypothetical protein
LPGRHVQHEAALGLHRPAEVDGRVLPRRDLELQVDLVEQAFQGQLGRPVDHQAERALLGVLADVDHRAGEIRIQHRRHRDQELVCQVHGFAAFRMSFTFAGIVSWPAPRFVLTQAAWIRP